MDPIQKVSIIDQVVETLKASINEGKFTEGQKLPSEKELCATLKVSRSTIREAFRVLETSGYIVLKPGRGAFVNFIDEHDAFDARSWFRINAPRLKDFIEVREAIESLAVRIAATKRTEEELKELDRVRLALEVAVEQRDVPEMARLDELFHRLIVMISGNTLLQNINNLVSKEFEKYRSVSFGVQKNAVSAIEPHRMIFEAIREQDAEAAVKSMVYHLIKAKDDMDEVIEE